jgi:hypothetical protein
MDRQGKEETKGGCAMIFKEYIDKRDNAEILAVQLTTENWDAVLKELPYGYEKDHYSPDQVVIIMDKNKELAIFGYVGCWIIAKNSFVMSWPVELFNKYIKENV